MSGEYNGEIRIFKITIVSRVSTISGHVYTQKKSKCYLLFIYRIDTLHIMEYMNEINSLRMGTSGEDGCGIGSHQVKARNTIDLGLHVRVTSQEASCFHGFLSHAPYTFQ